MFPLHAKVSLKLAGRLRGLIGRITNILHPKTNVSKSTHSETDGVAVPAAIRTPTQGSLFTPQVSSPSTPTFPFSDSPPETPPPTPPSDCPTKVIVILLCYKNQTWPSGFSKELRGTVNDLELFLRKFNYRHSQCDCFKIITDIDLTFRDSEGVERPIRAEYPTRENIRDAICSTASKLTPKDNCLIFYGGHAVQSPVEGNPQEGSLLPIDGEPIYGWELRDWLTKGVNRWAPITLVLDACYSENLLDLPISYDEHKDGIQLRRKLSVKRRDNNLTVVAAAGETQNAHSSPRFDPDYQKLYGVLTWVMLDIISDPNHGGTMVSTKQLYSKASERWRQNPRVTTTRKPNHGELAIFNLQSLTVAC